MRAKITWQEGVSFLGQTESGHAITMDGAPEAGGENMGPRPMEMMLIGLGGCTAFDVVYILRKSRQEITDCQVEMDAQRADKVPKIFTHIHLHFIVIGKKLDTRLVERAINLSAQKYCSASMMLKATVNITHDFEVREAE
jgi:putative redox protein